MRKRAEKQRASKGRLRAAISGVLSLLLCLPVLFFCGNDYNPFEDESNTRAVLLSGIQDGDTLEIFTTDTLVVALTVAEHAESFSLHAESSRYFTDTVIVASGDELLGSGPYRFLVSFYDTGWVEISLKTRRSSGEEVVEKFEVYTRSPLNQRAVSGSMGDSIVLGTPSVKDRDVLYHWSFGRSVTVESVPPTVKSVIRTSGSSQTGELWVSDLSGAHASPRSLFLYSFTDKDGPVIVCANEGSVGKDTVTASEKNFFFKAHIYDYGSGVVYSAYAANMPFDLISSNLYVKELAGIDTIPQPWPLTITASDPFSNQSQKTFWIVYDSTLAPSNPHEITVTVPIRDSLVTGKRDWTIIGFIENYSADSLDLSMCVKVNNHLYGDTLHLNGIYKVPWSFRINLPEYINTISVLAFDKDRDLVAEKKFVMIYDPHFVDNSAPTLVELTVDGKQAGPGGVIVENDSALMRIVAFDEGSGIGSVTVNGTAVTLFSSYIWQKRVTADHSEKGSTYTVQITDSTGLVTARTTVLRQNRQPKIVKTPDPPLPFVAGGTYEDNIIAVDADNDEISYHKMKGPESLNVNQNTGNITWTPALSDTGTWQISIAVRDLFGAVPYTFSIRVVDSSGIPDPVRFKVTEDQFPEILEAGKDSLNIRITTVAGTGKPPLHFKAVKKARETSVIPIVDGWLKWNPAPADTGFHQFVITVSDSFKNTDQIFPSLRVVPPNRPLSLSAIWKGKHNPESILDLSGSDSVQVLTVIIDDPDESIEQFGTNVKINSQNIDAAIDSGKISIEIDPLRKAEGYDTLVVSVSDKAGHSDAVELIIYYGTAPRTPVLILPENREVITDREVEFRWSCSDSDGNPLRYDLFLAYGDSSFSLEASGLSDTSYSTAALLKAGTYYWKVKASDNKSSSVSDITFFTVEPPQRVRFKTSLVEFPSFLETGDELKVALRIKEGTGTAPFDFKAFANGKSVPVTGDTLLFTPAEGDTGFCNLVVSVKDSTGNSDTIKALIHIVPSNRPFTVSKDFVLNSNLELDLSGTMKPETLTFVITDPDPVDVERHTVKTSLLNTERVETAGPDGVFRVIVDPTLPGIVRDTLSIVITDRGGVTVSLSYVIYYGRPPHVPSLPFPVVDTAIYATDIPLSWKGGDPDGNPVSYAVYYSLSEEELSYAGTTEDTTFTLTELLRDTLYQWRIVAFDGRDSAYGPLWTFGTYNQIAKIYLNTTSSGADISTDVTGFPLKVTLDSTVDFSVVTPGNILFKKSNRTSIPFEIELWSAEQKTAVIWVLLDTVYANSNTQYIAVECRSGVAGENSAAVFGTFEGVWHMGPQEGIIPDASGNGNHGSLNGMTESNATAGIAGSAMSFDWGRYIVIGDMENLKISSDLTIEAWVKTNVAARYFDNYQPIVTKGNYSYHLELEYSTKKPSFVTYDYEYNDAIGNDALQNGVWYHIAGVFTRNSVRLYVNGALQTDTAAGDYINVTTSPFAIGYDADNPMRWFRGAVDEVRISSSMRTESWIKLTYENIRKGSNFARIMR